jgi:hypothetical protein
MTTIKPIPKQHRMLKRDAKLILEIIELLPKKERIDALQIFINNYMSFVISYRDTYRKELLKEMKNSKSVPRIHTSKSYQ